MSARASPIGTANSRTQRGGIVSKLLVLLMTLAAVAAIYSLRRPVLRAAGHFWVVNEAPDAADAIIILGDDNYLAERASRAAELYHAGWAPRVIASGRYLRPYASIAELMEKDLRDRGVPAEAIARFPHRAANTREEAFELRGLLRQHGWHRVLVVTSNFHTRRARYIFRRALPADIGIRIVAARDSGYDADAWWESRAGVRFFFHESVAFCLAVWEMRQAASLTPVYTRLALYYSPRCRLATPVFPFGRLENDLSRRSPCGANRES
jgi:uncharacterized SAM-binding protein YcdF (DUF218 family)